MINNKFDIQARKSDFRQIHLPDNELKSSFNDFELVVDELDDVLISFCLKPLFGFHRPGLLIGLFNCMPFDCVHFGLNISSAETGNKRRTKKINISHLSSFPNQLTDVLWF